MTGRRKGWPPEVEAAARNKECARCGGGFKLESGEEIWHSGPWDGFVCTSCAKELLGHD